MCAECYSDTVQDVFKNLVSCNVDNKIIPSDSAFKLCELNRVGIIIQL